MLALLLLSTVLASSSSSELDLPTVTEALRSSPALLKLFAHHTADLGLAYSSAEAPLRLRLFRKTLNLIDEVNSDADLGWKAGVNFCAALTEAEKAAYNGFNASGTLNPDAPTIAALPAVEAAIDWRTRGAVTSIKRQIGGSCWTYSTVHCVEGMFQILTGRLVEFAEQELLDCVYEGTGHDGANGGMQNVAYDWLTEHQRLAPRTAYPQVGGDNVCNNQNKANGLDGVRVNGFTKIPKNEQGMVNALNRGPISTNFHATQYTTVYSSGVFHDPTCRSGFYSLNHAVTAVGYTAHVFIIKNSYGTGWGEQGYARFRRGWHGCGLFQDNMIVELAFDHEEE